MKTVTVKSINPFKSPPEWLSRSGVIQTFYDIVRAHGGKLKVETREGEETTFIITL